eukprot:7643456-Ditylum_brightwellii.AAC.1
MKKNETRLVKIGDVTFTANELKKGIMESTGDIKEDNSEYNKKVNVMQKHRSFYLDLQRKSLHNLLHDKWEIEDVTKEDIRGLASDLFFLGNHYNYQDNQKLHGKYTAISFKDKVKDYW